MSNLDILVTKMCGDKRKFIAKIEKLIEDNVYKF